MHLLITRELYEFQRCIVNIMLSAENLENLYLEAHLIHLWTCNVNLHINKSPNPTKVQLTAEGKDEKWRRLVQKNMGLAVGWTLKKGWVYHRFLTQNTISLFLIHQLCTREKVGLSSQSHDEKTLMVPRIFLCTYLYYTMKLIPWPTISNPFENLRKRKQIYQER